MVVLSPLPRNGPQSERACRLRKPGLTGRTNREVKSGVADRSTAIQTLLSTNYINGFNCPRFLTSLTGALHSTGLKPSIALLVALTETTSH